MNGTTTTTGDLPDPLVVALDEVLFAVNGVDPVEPDAEFEDCSEQELHIHKQLGRIRALIFQIRAESVALTDQPGPEVTEVYDRDGDVWKRDCDGNWRYDGRGDATDWAYLADLYSPLTIAPQGGAR